MRGALVDQIAVFLRRSVLTAAFVIAALPAACGRPPHTGVGNLIIVENATVLTMSPSGVLAAARIEVRDGRIADVTAGAGSAARPPGAHVIDARGKFILPGLVDMHVHFVGEPEGIMYLANGVTTVRNMSGSLDVIRLVQIFADGVSPGPTIYTSGPMIDGRDPVWGAEAIEATNPQEARAAVEALRAAGFEAVKLYSKLDPDSYAAALEAAKAARLQVWTHVPPTMSVSRVLALAPDSIEHLDGYGRALAADAPSNASTLARWAGADQSKMAALAAETAAANVANAPTFSVNYRRFLYAANSEAFLARPEASRLEPEILDYWRARTPSLRDADAPIEEGAQMQRRFLKALHDAGAIVLIGTDAPNPFVLPGYAIHDEIADFVAAGLTPDETLRIATADAAKFLDKDGEFGSIAAGLRADFILLDDDPRRNLSTLRDPAGVMARGRWYDREDLRAALSADTARSN